MQLREGLAHVGVLAPVHRRNPETGGRPGVVGVGQRPGGLADVDVVAQAERLAGGLEGVRENGVNHVGKVCSGMDE